jgi:hypothetical protein
MNMAICTMEASIIDMNLVVEYNWLGRPSLGMGPPHNEDRQESYSYD